MKSSFSKRVRNDSLCGEIESLSLEKIIMMPQRSFKISSKYGSTLAGGEKSHFFRSRPSRKKFLSNLSANGGWHA